VDSRERRFFREIPSTKTLDKGAFRKRPILGRVSTVEKVHAGGFSSTPPLQGEGKSTNGISEGKTREAPLIRMGEKGLIWRRTNISIGICGDSGSWVGGKRLLSGGRRLEGKNLFQGVSVQIYP